jgi:hypothetical protein
VSGWLAAGLVLAAYVGYLAWYFLWEQQNTEGLAYFGRASADRRLLKRRIRAYSAPVIPAMRFIALWNRRRRAMPSFEVDGVCGPPGFSSPETFAGAARYEPEPHDVFVASQMRSGTTWMLQLVYEIARRGRGDLGDAGHRQIHAVCPWIETSSGVPLGAAPLVGDPPIRIIKTHLPARLCPYSERAKYIYVVRHPVSCCASVMAYFRTLSGPLAPADQTLVDWFCSDRMYWLPWPEHVAGWLEWAASRRNVLFVRYEDMAADLRGVLDAVSCFLGCSLTAAERDLVAGKCTFEYMKDREDLFEMAPPTMFSVRGGEFLTGPAKPARAALTPEMRARVVAYCRRALQAADDRVARLYPDLDAGQAARS